MSVSIPVFTIHGNHDDLAGVGGKCTCVFVSLVSRLLLSRTQMLKLCRWRKPDIFPHMSTAKGRKTLIVCGYIRRTGK